MPAHTEAGLAWRLLVAAPVGKGRVLGRPLALVLNRSPREQCVDGKSNLYSTSLHLDSVFCKARLCEGNRWSNPHPGLPSPGPIFQPCATHLEMLLNSLELQISQGGSLPRSTRPAEARVISRGL